MKETGIFYRGLVYWPVFLVNNLCNQMNAADFDHANKKVAFKYADEIAGDEDYRVTIPEACSVNQNILNLITLA
jgi:hypothetical protein